METIITEWNTLVHLKDSIWLKIEEPKRPKIPKEVEISLWHGKPDEKGSEEMDSNSYDYEDYEHWDEDEDDDE